MKRAAWLQPRACLGSIRPAAVAATCRLARVSARPLRQPVRCAAEPLQAAVDVATHAPAALAAGGASSPGGLEVWDVVWDACATCATMLVAFLAFFIFDRIKESAKEKKAAEDYERLKASLPNLGYHPTVVARLESMPASKFYAIVDSQAEYLLLWKWDIYARQVSQTGNCMGHVCTVPAGRQVECMAAEECPLALTSDIATLLRSVQGQQLEVPSDR